MDAQQARADLTEISSQNRAAGVFGDNGKVVGSTLADPDRAGALARTAAELLAVADGVKSGDGTELTQLEAATDEGSVFVVREGKPGIAATTGVDPTVGLVFYDLKSALRNLEHATEPKRRGGPREKKGTPPPKKPAPPKKATPPPKKK